MLSVPLCVADLVTREEGREPISGAGEIDERDGQEDCAEGDQTNRYGGRRVTRTR
jgi:hypothetical protein